MYFRLAHRLLFVLSLPFLALTASCQSSNLILTHLDEDNLNSLALQTAQRIREAHLEEAKPKILVIDFFHSSPRNTSQLGTILADRFSQALTAYSKGLDVLDRKILKEYLIQNWTTLEDLGSNEVCLRIGRQLGATGVILGTLYEENGYVSLTVRIEGFGVPAKDRDGLPVMDERTRFLQTEEMHSMLFQPGPDFTRTSDDIPQEPGVLLAGTQGVTTPACISCPPPDYSDVARAARYQGTVQLSIVVTAEGQATSIYVLKGAPFGLTAKAIEVTRRWHFKPAQRDGKPVSVRVQVEGTFRSF